MVDKKVLYRDCKRCGELTTIRNKGVMFCLKCSVDIKIEKVKLKAVSGQIEKAIAKGVKLEESKDKVCPTRMIRSFHLNGMANGRC